MPTRLFWDFFGGDAERTAAHFREHLDQFLVREALVGCTTGLVSAGPSHHAAWCVAPDAVLAPIERTLRPRRRADEPESTE